MKRKVCVITGSRSEYGLLRHVMLGIKADKDLELQIIATGMHLSPEFGYTFRDIENDGFQIERKVEILMSSDTEVGISKSMGLAMISFAEALNELRPDLIVVLGDRFEIFSAVSAALIARIPVAHLHGGETTTGAIDEAIRHSITKMSHLHFVAAEDYKKRVIQLGEDPENVHIVGGLGVDLIAKTPLINRRELEVELGFDFKKKNLLITFHPITLENNTSSKQMRALLDVLSQLKDTRLIFTMPNADTGGRELISMVNSFVTENNNACAFKSLGHVLYLSCLANVDGVVGNSSSGIIEAPSFRKGTLNIGDRQCGRLQANSVINCEPVYSSIKEGVHRLFTPEFQSSLLEVTNPYGDGGASEKIVGRIKAHPLDGLVKKRFFDLDFHTERH